MASTNIPKSDSAPQPRLSFEQNSEAQHTRRPVSEFNPCANAKITSPFYLYNHDSPRPSQDMKPRAPVTVSVRDLESAGDLSPSITQEKRGSADSGRVRLWSRWVSKREHCRTKARVPWFSQLPPWQRLIIKLLIGLVLVGIIVGIAVGISIKVNGSVYKGKNSTSDIGE
jgi:hypothetical protein